MKKLMAMLMLMMVITSAAYASAVMPGKKIDPNTWQGCINRPYTECPSTNKAQPWHEADWLKCEKKIQESCRCIYRPDLVRLNTQPCA